VGEEGQGDLRGIKAIFRDHPDIDGFVSIDGSGLTRMTTGGTGSRRFAVEFTGPGGHSFSAFGMVSAIHAMGRAITRIGDLQVPETPRTTFTVGTVTGGTSVNSIAADAMFELDMRSNDAAELARLEAQVREVTQAAVEEENARWNNNGEITVNFRLIGDWRHGLGAAAGTGGGAGLRGGGFAAGGAAYLEHGLQYSNVAGHSCDYHRGWRGERRRACAGRVV